MQTEFPDARQVAEHFRNTPMPHVQQVTARVMRHVPAGKSVGGVDLDRPLPPRQALGQEPVIFLNGLRLRWGEGQDVWDGENPEAGELRFAFDLNFQIPAPGYRLILGQIYSDVRYNPREQPMWRRALTACRALRHLRYHATKTETSPDILIVYVSYT